MDRLGEETPDLCGSIVKSRETDIQALASIEKSSSRTVVQVTYHAESLPQTSCRSADLGLAHPIDLSIACALHSSHQTRLQRSSPLQRQGM